MMKFQNSENKRTNIEKQNPLSTYSSSVGQLISSALLVQDSHFTVRENMEQHGPDH